MGFGILFIGFIFTVFDAGTLYADSLSYLFMIGLCFIGWVVTAAGCSKLKTYLPKMKNASLCASTLAALTLCRLVIYGLRYLNSAAPTILTRVASVLTVLCALVYGIFMFFSLTALGRICAETELPKLSRRADRMRLVMMVFSSFDVVASLQLPNVGDYLSPIRFIFYVITVLINAQLIFRCYMWICLESDLEMKPKEKKHKREISEEEAEVERLWQEKKRKSGRNKK